MTQLYTCAEGLQMCDHVSSTHPLFVFLLHERKSLLELVSRSWPAALVPAVLVNTFSTLRQAGPAADDGAAGCRKEHMSGSSIRRRGPSCTH